MAVLVTHQFYIVYYTVFLCESQSTVLYTIAFLISVKGRTHFVRSRQINIKTNCRGPSILPAGHCHHRTDPRDHINKFRSFSLPPVPWSCEAKAVRYVKMQREQKAHLTTFGLLLLPEPSVKPQVCQFAIAPINCSYASDYSSY